MNIGIIGAEGCGKTLLYCLLSNHEYSQPFAYELLSSKIRTASIHIPDPRLEELYKTGGNIGKKTFASINITDTLPIISKESDISKRSLEVLGLIRECDALALVIPYKNGDSKAKINTRISELKNELFLADLAIIEKRLLKLKEQISKPTPEQEDYRNENKTLLEIKAKLEEGKEYNPEIFNEKELKQIRGYMFFSAKPLIPIINIFTDDPPGKLSVETGYFALNIKLEEELASMEENERVEFMEAYGMEKFNAPELPLFLACKSGMIFFFTFGPKETRAWITEKDSPAPYAAGKIHSDMERGFITAEVCDYSELIEAKGSFKELKNKGKLRLEGKKYIVSDGNIFHVNFNV